MGRNSTWYAAVETPGMILRFDNSGGAPVLHRVAGKKGRAEPWRNGDSPLDVSLTEVRGLALDRVGNVYFSTAHLVARIVDDKVIRIAGSAPVFGPDQAIPPGAFGGDGGAATALSWSEPDRSGTSAARYDLLRASTPTGFEEATCLASAVASRNASDPQVPAPGAVNYYLVRTRSACGANLGTSSDGGPRQGASCPQE